MQEGQRLDSLEGLRFLSSLAIVAGHYVPYAVSTPLIARLHLAVDLFFVISGVVIAERYAGRIAGGVDYVRFMGRRIARLYPLHLATLLFYVAIGVLVWSGRLQPNDAARYNPDMILPNLLMVHAWSPFSPISFNYVSWSISAEMFVYLLFPLLFLALRTRPVAGLAAILAAVAGLAMVAPALTGWPLTRVGWQGGIMRALPGFAFGVWLSCHAGWVAARLPLLARPVTLGVLLGAVVVLMLLRANEFALLALIWALVAAAFLCDRAGRSTPVSVPFLAKRGELTYSIYMLHTVVATLLLAFAVPRLLGTAPEARLAGVLIALPMLYILSLASLHLFEQPLRRRLNAATDRWLPNPAPQGTPT